MNKVFMLLDRSGSMSTMWKEAIGGINGYVAALTDKNTEIMLASFDTVSYDVIRNTSLANWEPLTNNEITPRGGTPLLDAAGRIIWSMIDSRAKRAILVVITDGEENSSSKFKASEIKNLTKTISDEKGFNYEVVFLGANFDKIGEVAAHNFGNIDSSRFVATSSRGFGDAMNATASATREYFNTGTIAKEFYSQEDKAKAAE